MNAIYINELFPFSYNMLVCFFLFVHNQNQAWRILNQTDSIEVKEKKKLERKKSYNNSSFSTES